MKRENRNGDLALIERILFPLGVVAGLLGMSAGIMICFGVL